MESLYTQPKSIPWEITNRKITRKKILKFVNFVNFKTPQKHLWLRKDHGN